MDAKLDALFQTHEWRIRHQLVRHQVDHRASGHGIEPVEPPQGTRKVGRFMRGAASLVRSARLEQHRNLRGA